MTSQQTELLQSGAHPRKAPHKIITACLVAGLALSTLGLAIAFKLFTRAWQVLDAFFHFDFSLDGMQARANPLEDFASPFVLFPLLALSLWLLCALGLLYINYSSKNDKPARAIPFALKDWRSWLSPGLLLAAILFLAFVVRAARLLPDAANNLPASNYDEMVYFTASAQLAGGHLPYRDFFLAHPPGALLLFGPLFKLLNGESGGYNAFVAARWLTVLLGLVTCGVLAWSGARLWQKDETGNEPYKTISWAAPGLLAALVYALDGIVAQVAVLETISNFFAVLSLFCFLEGWRRNGDWWMISAGALAGLAFLSKLPGLAIIFALLVYLAWRARWKAFGLVAGGIAGALALVGGIFALLAGPGTFLRQVVFFQVLRPQEVREGKDQIETIADYPGAGLTVFLATLVFILLAWRLWRGRVRNDLWLIPVLWTFPVVAIFIFGKSFHPWYYVQLALPLALFSGGLLEGVTFPGKIKTVETRPALSLSSKSLLIKVCMVIAVLIFAAPLLARQWQSGQNPPVDPVYTATADFLKGQPGHDPVLSFDPGYAFMAGRSPARLPDGKILVDSAGYMVYLNLDIDRKGLLDLAGQLFNLNRERGQVDTLFKRDRAQALVSSAVRPGMWSVLDEKIGLPQLTPRSVEYIATAGGKVTRIGYGDLYKARPDQPALREWQFDNGLRLTPLGLSSSFQGKANFDPVQGNTLTIPAKEAGTRTLDLRLVWSVTATPPQQAKFFAHLINEQTGQRVAQRDLLPLDGQADTRNWRKGDYYQDVHSLPLPADLAPGRYRVVIGLYDAASGQRIMVEGQDSILLGYVQVG